MVIYKKQVKDAFGNLGTQYRTRKQLFTGSIIGEIWPSEELYTATDNDDKIVCIAETYEAAEARLLKDQGQWRLEDAK